MLTTLQSVGCLYDSERNNLLHGYKQLYDKWMYEMWYVLFCLFCLLLVCEYLPSRGHSMSVSQFVRPSVRHTLIL